jgi:hypothetical protein
LHAPRIQAPSLTALERDATIGVKCITFGSHRHGFKALTARPHHWMPAGVFFSSSNMGQIPIVQTCHESTVIGELRSTCASGFAFARGNSASLCNREKSCDFLRLSTALR